MLLDIRIMPPAYKSWGYNPNRYIDSSFGVLGWSITDDTIVPPADSQVIARINFDTLDDSSNEEKSINDIGLGIHGHHGTYPEKPFGSVQAVAKQLYDKLKSDYEADLTPLTDVELELLNHNSDIEEEVSHP